MFLHSYTNSVLAFTCLQMDAHFTYKGSFLDQEMWFRFYQNPQFSGPLEMSTGYRPLGLGSLVKFPLFFAAVICIPARDFQDSFL